jgi:hypothetical protein
MGVTERTVRRCWTIARDRLFQALKENLPPEAARITIESDRLGLVRASAGESRTAIDPSRPHRSLST